MLLSWNDEFHSVGSVAQPNHHRLNQVTSVDKLDNNNNVEMTNRNSIIRHKNETIASWLAIWL